MNCTIREMNHEEYPLLDEFLYQAIFVPKGMNAPPRSILQEPEIMIYVDAFGSRPDDHALVALVDQKIVGAIWVRIMHDYGFVDDVTPSLSMSVLKEYRGLGIGTNLLERMLVYLREKGYAQVSLSVQRENYAYPMYQRAGFRVIKENAEDFVMVCEL